ncbi:MULTISPECIES: alpha/beta hydrolase family protein [Methylobacterium]|uniref:alpha/beta hydrolase family protein n=1 Tax=Methylobacterium TaxID=407 RepID=UPI0028B24A68|nr:prolyl oligopeptidase family serine peptidase [Methylobacterium sp. DB0501]
MDGTGAPLEVAIWYPTKAAPRPTRIGPLVQDVAPDAATAGRDLPLVVLSHGTGGGLTSHADTALALAEAGIVAAALDHAGDDWRDRSRVLDLDGRVGQFTTVAAALVAGQGGLGIDPARVGAFGFSAGGFTVLAAAGGRPDLDRIGPHCATLPDFYDCRLLAQETGQGRCLRPVVPAPAPPLAALVVAAPALGFTFTRPGLADVSMPVQLWQAGDDEILPAPHYVEPVAAALPHPPDLHVVEGARHYDFLVPCPPDLARTVPEICQSAPGFDRAAFHARFNAAIVAFFDQALARAPQAGGPSGAQRNAP